jgi:hypothetical protein
MKPKPSFEIYKLIKVVYNGIDKIMGKEDRESGPRRISYEFSYYFAS